MPSLSSVPGGKKIRRLPRKDAKGDRTLSVSFRCDSHVLRQIDEIVASRFDYEIKTRTDVLNDAASAWVEENMAAYIEAGNRDHLHWDFYVIKRNRDRRAEELDVMAEEMNHHDRNDNLSSLRQLRMDLTRLLNEINQDEYGDNSQKKEVKIMLESIQRIIARFDD